MRKNRPKGRLKYRSIFIAGNDTGVGKTVITGLLANFLSRKGYKVTTQKWVESGGENGFSSDLKEHKKIAAKSMKNDPAFEPDRAPYVLSLAASPHLAAKSERRIIEKRRIIKSHKRLIDHHDICLCEGSGGLMVPLNNRLLLIDLVEEMKIPLLLVVQNRLGAINQTLLALEAVKKRNIKCLGVVFSNDSTGTNNLILKDNAKIVKNFSSEKIFGALPRIKSKNQFEKLFSKIGQSIYTVIKKS